MQNCERIHAATLPQTENGTFAHFGSTILSITLLSFKINSYSTSVISLITPRLYKLHVIWRSVLKIRFRFL